MPVDKLIGAPPLLFLVDRFAGDYPGAPSERAPAWIPAGRVEFSESSGIAAEIATIHERTLPVEKRAGVDRRDVSVSGDVGQQRDLIAGGVDREHRQHIVTAPGRTLHQKFGLRLPSRPASPAPSSTTQHR